MSQFELAYEPAVVFHSVTIFERYSVLGEVELTTDDAVRILASRESAKIGEHSVKLIARGSMRSVIITQLPEVVSEKDLYLVLNKFNPLLKRVVIADDSEVSLFLPQKPAKPPCRLPKCPRSGSGSLDSC